MPRRRRGRMIRQQTVAKRRRIKAEMPAKLRRMRQRKTEARISKKRNKVVVISRKRSRAAATRPSQPSSQNRRKISRSRKCRRISSRHLSQQKPQL